MRWHIEINNQVQLRRFSRNAIGKIFVGCTLHADDISLLLYIHYRLQWMQNWWTFVPKIDGIWMLATLYLFWSHPSAFTVTLNVSCQSCPIMGLIKWNTSAGFYQSVLTTNYSSIDAKNSCQVQHMYFIGPCCDWILPASSIEVVL